MNEGEVIMPVILCGGSGTRLWPLSRKSLPKQYLSINSTENLTLLQNTQKRLENIDNIINPIIICNQDHRFIVAEQMREINISPNAILLEPFGKNTCAPIVISALKALKDNLDPIILVLSSDHQILDSSKFIKTIEAGVNYASKGRIVLFGVIPSSPATGYGYIKSTTAFKKGDLKGLIIDKFIEKPDLDNAKEFIKDKRYTWNSGIFMFRASNLLNEIKKIFPEMLSECKKCIENITSDLDFYRLNKKLFNNVPNLSFDVGIMEKTNLGTVLPLDAGWSDIGTWNSVWKVSKKDNNSNYIKGNIELRDSKNCYVEGHEKIIYGLGLNNLVIIQTDDATLVIDQNKAEEVKDIVKDLISKNILEGKEHKKIYRPWGNYTSITEGKNWKIKIIMVNPGQSLSLQKHNHRSEHWVVVKGIANVEIDNQKIILKENESTYIPSGSIHRLSNTQKYLLKLVEIQSGDYLGEDDIIRFKDIYGRN